MINKKNNFTLVELLAVLIISGIILGLTLPALNTMVMGQSVENAALNLGSELKAVRAFAVTKKVYVALIFPVDLYDASLPLDNISPTYISKKDILPNKYNNKSFRPCIVNRDNEFQFWITDNKWEFLTTGAVVLDIDDTVEYDAGKFTESTEIHGVNFYDIDSSKTSCEARGIVFKPNGQVVSGIKYVVVGSVHILNGGSVKDNMINIIIDEYSGRISYLDKLDA